MSNIPLAEIEALEDEVIIHVHSKPPPRSIIEAEVTEHDLDEALLDHHDYTCSLARKNTDNKSSNWRILIALALCIAFM
jgi:hypothetical protein